MMTFRPYADHRKSARVLDNKRLGKQRVECLQIMGAMLAHTTGETGGGWINHPIVRMWAGLPNPYVDNLSGFPYLVDLLDYYDAIVEEWKARGFKHQMEYRVLPFRALAVNPVYPAIITQTPLPWSPEKEKQHKLILLRKDPDWYGQFWRRKVLPSLRTEGSPNPTD